MAIGLIFFLMTLVAAWALDSAVRPRSRGMRRWQGLFLLSLIVTGAFGIALGASGNPLAAMLLTVATMTLLIVSSNAKHAMLGEPLLFSDLALLGWVFRHPRFYLTALSARQRWMIGIGAPALIFAFVGSFEAGWGIHIAGIGLFLAGAGGAAVVPGTPAFRRLAQRPDLEDDVSRFGLVTTLWLYWLRWRATPDPMLPVIRTMSQADSPELIVVIQCESFADPVALSGDRNLALPGLALARARAWQWGRLHVSGFGAYTMRTEYGVLFGRDEDALGFRRYDPFLTALGETSYALPRQLAPFGYRSIFVHPHDMRFYGRDRLMPAAGFEALIGEEAFPPVRLGGSRYVTDRALGASLAELIEQASQPTMIYAVTMENHGPWIRDPKTGSHGGLTAYLHHLNNSDAMLSEMIKTVSAARRSALLVFFGDHRPSIPGVTLPGDDRHTPYIMMRFSPDGQIMTGTQRCADLAPYALHHAILRTVAD